MDTEKGICLTALYPAAMENSKLLTELFQKVKKSGFQCAEYYFNGTDGEEVQIRKALASLGLSSVFLAGYPMKRDGINLSAEKEEDRQNSVSACRELYRHAKNLRADKMLIVSGPAWEKEEKEKLALQMQKSLEELAGETGAGDPEITLEFFNNKGEPWLAVGDIPLVRKIFESIKTNKIGITFDTSHVVQLKSDVFEAFRELKPWIHHLHLANSVSGDPEHALYGDKHPLFGITRGDFSLQEIRDIYMELKENQLLRNVDLCSFEVISRGNEEWFYNEVCKEAEFVFKKL